MQGLLLLDKPSGITSFGAVARIRRLSHEKRAGHTGTLDPMATGVLPILLGRATALSSYLLEADKTYIASVKLGVATDTLDITGEITDEKPVSADNSAVLSVLESFVGKQLQVPPIYSALKHNGERLYNIARRGETADIPPREIEIFSVKQVSPLKNNEFSFEARVSKGTYIRSLVRDIGERLGTCAVLTELERTNTAGFDISSCVSLEGLTEENISEYLLPADRAVMHLKRVNVTKKQAVRFSNGGQLDLDRLKIEDKTDKTLYRVYSGQTFLGLGIIETDKNQLAVKCIIQAVSL